MPINLNAPLAWTKANADELKLLQNLQGNILKGHGRDYTANIFFRFSTSQQRASRRLLRDLANHHLTNAHRQLLATEHFKATGEGGGGFVHLALSFKGYEALGRGADAPTDPDFRAGMKDGDSISRLNDPDPSSWDLPFQQESHGIVLVAHETESAMAQLASEIKTLITDAHGTIVFVQHGKALRNADGVGIENFGYVDGRSQPLMLHEDIDAEIAAAGASRWDPAFPLSTALVADPGASDDTSFGSYFVFRKLEQAVRAFKAHEQDIADVLELEGDQRELAGALIVGRFEDGTPVTLTDEARAAPPPNNFNYHGDTGTRCPLHAHIRKTNPRGSGGFEPELAERAHLMARRGIPYEDVKRITHPEEVPDVDSHGEFDAEVAPLLPDGGVGLLFMAYNREIGQQFAFTQATWANNPGFPNASNPPGIDPVIGQGQNNPGDQKLPKDWDEPPLVSSGVEFSGFVTMRGGEYFFSPSLTFLMNL